MIAPRVHHVGENYGVTNYLHDCLKCSELANHLTHHPEIKRFSNYDALQHSQIASDFDEIGTIGKLTVSEIASNLRVSWRIKIGICVSMANYYHLVIISSRISSVL